MKNTRQSFIYFMVVLLISSLITLYGQGSKDEGSQNTPESPMGVQEDLLPPVTPPGVEGGQFVKPSKDTLKTELTSLQYRVTQEEGTEAPFQNEYWDNHEEGIYVDIVSGEPLFSSTDKFESGTGWPSFTRPLAEGNVNSLVDRKLGMARTEVRSFYADSHLGHVFNDGPEPTGLRYCINSASLRFIPVKDLEKEGYSAYLSLFNKSSK